MKRKGIFDKRVSNEKSRDIIAKLIQEFGKIEIDQICEGDIVRLNVDRITGRKDYLHKQEEYKQFVESNRDKDFVAHLFRQRDDESNFSALIELKGAEKWLFWEGDLLRVKNNQAEVRE